jgi:hypothetical protein
MGYIDYDLVFNNDYNYNDLTNISRNKFLFILFNTHSYTTMYVFYKLNKKLSEDEEKFIKIYNYFCNTDKKTLAEIFEERELKTYLKEYTITKLNTIATNSEGQFDDKIIDNCKTWNDIYTNELYYDLDSNIPIFLYPLHVYQNNHKELILLLNSLFVHASDIRSYYRMFWNFKNAEKINYINNDLIFDKNINPELQYFLINYNLNIAIKREEYIRVGNSLNLFTVDKISKSIVGINEIQASYYKFVSKRYEDVLEELEALIEFKKTPDKDITGKIRLEKIYKQKFNDTIYNSKLEELYDIKNKIIEKQEELGVLIQEFHIQQNRVRVIKPQVEKVSSYLKKLKLYRNLLFEANVININNDNEEMVYVNKEGQLQLDISDVNDYDFPIS